MADCDDTICTGDYDEDGNPIGGTDDSSSTSCDSSGCPTTNHGATCKPWQLSKSKDNCFIDDVVEENLAIGGADINVFRLLGVHEQGRLVDLTENGSAISGGDVAGYPKEQAFTTYTTEWRSTQKGDGVTASAYIGYDFGEIKLDNNRVRYSVDTSIKHNVASVKIKQGANAVNRATRVRVERSSDKVKWYGASIITLPNDDCWNTILFKNTVPMRYWRLRPIAFNGGASDPWAVQALELFDYDLTSIDDIQDKLWHENRDRDYSDQSIELKASYDLLDVQSDMARFGIELPSQTFYLTVSFNAAVQKLGRPLVIGDIIEMPSEVQYTPSLEPIKKYMEVTDVAWSTEGYTPGWQPLLQRIIVAPMLATQETADIFGGLEGYADGTGFFEQFDGSTGMDDGQHPVFQDYSDVSQTIEETATDVNHTPERGRDPSDITQFSDAQLEAAELQQRGASDGLKNIGMKPRQLYVEDGLPPNGLPFTEGDEMPTTPSDGDFHRLTYLGIDESIPARLFRYSVAKGRWVFMESDKRASYDQTKPILQEFLGSSTRTPADDIAK